MRIIKSIPKILILVFIASCDPREVTMGSRPDSNQVVNLSEQRLFDNDDRDQKHFITQVFSQYLASTKEEQRIRKAYNFVMINTRQYLYQMLENQEKLYKAMVDVEGRRLSRNQRERLVNESQIKLASLTAQCRRAYNELLEAYRDHAQKTALIRFDKTKIEYPEMVTEYEIVAAQYLKAVSQYDSAMVDYNKAIDNCGQTRSRYNKRKTEYNRMVFKRAGALIEHAVMNVEYFLEITEYLRNIVKHTAAKFKYAITKNKYDRKIAQRAGKNIQISGEKAERARMNIDYVARKFYAIQ